jgi:hypothetical protein
MFFPRNKSPVLTPHNATKKIIVLYLTIFGASKADRLIPDITY